MATSYKTSPFSTDLITNLTRATDVVAAGAADITGTSGEVHAIHLINGDGATRYLSMLDSRTVTAGSADIIIPMDANANMTVFIDNGASFSTAISIAASTARAGTGDPTDVDMYIMSHDV